MFRSKLNSDSSINKYKARLVLKGYAQVFCVDSRSTIDQIDPLDTISLLLVIVAQKGWKVFQLDVNVQF